MSERISFELDMARIKSLVSVIRQIGSGVDAIRGAGTLSDAEPGDASFLSNSKYADALSGTHASLVFVPESFEGEPEAGRVYLAVENPSLALARICEAAATAEPPEMLPGAHETAIVDASAQIADSATVGPQVVIQEGVEIGEQCVVAAGCFLGKGTKIGGQTTLFPKVTIYENSVIGRRCRIHAGAVIGADGFGYEFSEGAHRKIPQLGNVEIGDDVEIGACSAIDRGRFGPTTVGDGTKIDNHVQIGHNVKIGKRCILCAQVGIAGSTVIEDYAVFGGRAGASGHLRIGKGAQLAGCSAAFSNLEPGEKYGGTPAIPLASYQRISVLLRKLPDLFRRIKRLEPKEGEQE